MTEIEKLFQATLEKHLPFAAFQFPGENAYQYTIQLSAPIKIGVKDDFTDMSGFVLSPFNESDGCPSLLIKPDINGKQNDPIEHHLSLIQNTLPVEVEFQAMEIGHEATQDEYMDNVLHLRNKIRNGDFQKAILSRIIVQPKTGKLTDIFLMMCKRYHYSFIFLVNIPGLGTWIGASPELLFSRNKQLVSLVSLAGTQGQTHNDPSRVVWEDKEITEQHIVTEYLKNLLHEFGIRKYKQQGPETVQAGEVLHLKTTFTFKEGELKDRTSAFIQKLHPTPAVWGAPKTSALNIIKEREAYHREYYSGFLGPIEKNGSMDLYVNLRTMKALEDKLIIYVGSGITEDSVPKKEWEETCLKANTLQSVIKNNTLIV